MGLLLRFLGKTLDAVRVAIGLLLLIIGRGNVLALLIVNVAAELETGVFGRSSRSGTVGGRKRLARCDLGLRAGLERLQATRSIGNNAEMAGEGRSNVGGAGLRVDLVMSIKALEEKRHRQLCLPGS